MDLAARSKVSALVDTLTNSIGLELDQRQMRNLKRMGKNSDENVRSTFEVLKGKFKKNHSQVRYLALLIADQFFMRSKLFRALMVSFFETYLQLVIGYRTDVPLPPPKARADILKQRAIEILEKWNESYGHYYKQITLGYRFLKDTLQYQFPNARGRAAEEERKRREKEERIRMLYLGKYEQLKSNFVDRRLEVQQTLKEMRECILLLTPLWQIQGADSQSQRSVVVEDSKMMTFQDEHHINEADPDVTPDTTVSNTIERKERDEDIWQELDENDEAEHFGSRWLREVAMQEDAVETLEESIPHNPAVLEALTELLKLIMQRHLPLVSDWMNILTRVELDPASRGQHESYLKDVIDLRNLLQSTRAKCELMGLKIDLASSDNNGENDMEGVEWETVVASEPAGRLENLEKQDNAAGLGAHPTNIAPAEKLNGPVKEGQVDCVESSNKEPTLKERLLKEAPVVPWGGHLQIWGREEQVRADPRGLVVDNHWGRVDSDALLPAGTVRELNLQASYYSPISSGIPSQPCRHPLRKGGLCSRRDLIKCPLHGVIVPRDEKGEPLSQVKSPKSISSALELRASGLQPGTGAPGTLTVRRDQGEGKSSSLENRKAVSCERELDRGRHAGEGVASGMGLVTSLARQAVANLRERKRTRAAEVRLHNNSVLRQSAMSNSAQGLAEILGNDSDTLPHGGDRGRGGGSLSGMLKSKPTSKDRLARRLLNVKVKEATIQQAIQEEDRRHREAYPNRW